MRRLNYLILFLAALLSVSCTKKEKTLFELLDSKETGVEFANVIVEKDTLNILDNEYVYNGGGTAIGDLNGDGLQDIYFTGNEVPNKLYLNKGNFKFEDITEISKTQKRPKQWSSGVNFVDINLDGKLDIYVCNTLQPNKELRKNLLFVNQGNNEKGIPIFKEMAAEYGIDDASHSSNANFFDYDNDGDLDLFIAVNLIDNRYPNQFLPKISDGSSPTRDNLYENNWDEKLGHPVFKDVSIKAGIVHAGYSHSTLVCDFNHDGWLDIYVANDYVTNDLLFINDKNGHFTNQIADVFKHQSSSAMGSDFGDINNDGLMDMISMEMLPYANLRKKLFLSSNNYSTYIYNEQYKYEYQYPRNTLQLNRGNNPATGLPVFSDISFLANVQETDWSWTPLFADFDNDGFKDLMITNGFPRDVTDHDFGAFRATANNLVSKEELYNAIPTIKIPNFMFKNNGDLTFKDVSKSWGIVTPSFSNGAAYADLDNDGDLDVVINNIDDKAFIYRNSLYNENKSETSTANFLRFKLAGSDKNPDGFGTLVKIYYQGKIQVGEQTAARGYLSKSESPIHFGLGNVSKIDSVEVLWEGGKVQKIKQVPINQTVTLNYKNAVDSKGIDLNTELVSSSKKIFDLVNAKSLGLDYVNEEKDFIDFNIQRTLPHKFSQYGPGVSVGDMNGDGLDDVILGGSSRFDETIYIQQKNGKFIKKAANFKNHPEKKEEDLGMLLFDADGDGDNDLYLVRGSGQHDVGSDYYQHLLCVNDGKGNFKMDSLALGNLHTNGSAVKAVDFDGDGDLDLFVGGRVLPKSYPKTDRSFILRNDSQGSDKPHFTDVTKEVCPELAYIGMISDAIWTDFNNDGKPDLILAGEWMPLTFFQSNGKQLINITAQTNISDKVGWWNSIVGGDFDNDGDIDYVAGNFGDNIYFKCSSNEPITIYAKDFDGNGLYDAFISCYWRDSTEEKHEYFYNSRDDMIKQLVMIRRKFKTYGDYGKAQAKDVFTKEELQGAQIMKANWMNSSYIENLGGGKFKITALPLEAQVAPLYGMLPYDYDKDGFLDLLLVGNDYGMELLQGRADAFYGLVLKNIVGKKTSDGVPFKPVELDESDFFVPKDARGLTRISIGNQKELILATQNRDSLKIFSPKLNVSKIIPLKSDEVKAQILLKNGQKRLKEMYFGTSFISQEPRNITLDASIKEITLFNRQGKVTRTISN